jgi:glutamate/tyrosine decarboxylase-like PLP-dependent enzyme
MITESLSAELEKIKGEPVIVLLQAGDLNIGSYDKFDEIIPLAHSYGAWVHIDGAFGLWAAASDKYSHLLKGAELADSWAADGHKWLNVPYDCGYAFVAHPNSHKASMSYRASYLTHADDARDEMDWNPEWSRRGRGVATYAAIRQLGRKGIADLVDRCCRYADEIVSGIGKLKGAEIVWKPQINQGLVRFKHPSPNASETDNDNFTDDVMACILKNGEAFFGGTTWRGKRCMRVSVSSWQTNDSDVKRTVSAVGEALRETTAKHRS